MSILKRGKSFGTNDPFYVLAKGILVNSTLAGEVVQYDEHGLMAELAQKLIEHANKKYNMKMAAKQ